MVERIRLVAVLVWHMAKAPAAALGAFHQHGGQQRGALQDRPVPASREALDQVADVDLLEAIEEQLPQKSDGLGRGGAIVGDQLSLIGQLLEDGILQVHTAGATRGWARAPLAEIADHDSAALTAWVDQEAIAFVDGGAQLGRAL